MKNITEFILESSNNENIYYRYDFFKTSKQYNQDDIIKLMKNDIYLDGTGPYGYIAVSAKGAKNLLEIICKETKKSPKEILKENPDLKDAINGKGKKIDLILPDVILDKQLSEREINNLKRQADTYVAVTKTGTYLSTTFFICDEENIDGIVIPVIINHTQKTYDEPEELFGEYPELQKYVD